MITQAIDSSGSLAEACERFLDDIRQWVGHCIAAYAGAPPTDVHDQGTYTTGWEPYIQATGDKEALAFMKTLRDQIRDHYLAQGKWRHGYWTMQEAHHGTEHFELFLGSLWRLDSEDGATADQLVDAAEHMGNWVAEVPPWFDWQKRLFYSLFFGAEGVKTEPGMDINTPDHMRCANICLLAHQAGGDARYLELASVYAGHWVEAILAAEALPLGLTRAGPLYAFEGGAEALYRSFVGQAPELDSAVDRAENFLCSDTVQTFLRLWQLTAREELRIAAEKLLDVLVTQLDDPDAGPAAAALRQYRAITGDKRYDPAVLAVRQALKPEALETLTLDPTHRPKRRPAGIGKRGDMPRWLEDGQPRQHNPITLALAAEINGDERLATRALDLARTYFNLARQAFPDGRDHGCSARSVSAVARGHGRDNHAGMTTAVLGPLRARFLA